VVANVAAQQKQQNQQEMQFAESINSFSLMTNKNTNFIAHLEKIMNAKLKLKLEDEECDDAAGGEAVFAYDRTSDIMIYLNSKETFNKLDFNVGFRRFISKHYHEDGHKYNENIRLFNLHRQVILHFFGYIFKQF
jgi:hypothetical protein